MLSIEAALIAEALGVTESFVVNELIPILKADGKTFLTAAIAAAGPIVTSLESTNLSPTEKFETAVKEVGKFLVKEGKTVLDSTIQTAIQLAVTKLRSVV